MLMRIKDLLTLAGIMGAAIYAVNVFGYPAISAVLAGAYALTSAVFLLLEVFPMPSDPRNEP
jgi:fructose/tagatose bisphosphate aldolase